ncbi:MAG: hypothetical protein ACRD1E_03375 [Terriglobales bacterium]
MPGYRIGLMGGTTLLGKELTGLLRDRRFPALPVRLFELPARTGGKPNGAEATQAAMTGRLVDLGDEAAIQEELGPQALNDLQVLFLAGTGAEVNAAWHLARGAAALVVDLTGSLASEPEAVCVGLDPAVPAGSRLLAVAHPAAQALAHLFERLRQVAAIAAATVTVFEPASERGWAGIQELEQQSVKALGLQQLPNNVVGAQVAFNLRPELGSGVAPSLDAVRGQIVADLACLGEAAPPLSLLQAPLFHGTALLMWLRHQVAAPLAAVDASLNSPWLARPENGTEADLLATAGDERIQLSAPRADAAGGLWLFATLDNLRRRAACALDAAGAALRSRH